MQPLAQTNLQLYRELLAAGWDEEDVSDVRDAHEFAADVHSTQFRRSGKPFIAHLVGTASAVARAGAGSDMVRAALLHAVYQEGEFGSGVPGISERKRAAVQAVVGVDVDARVVCYTQHQLGLDELRAWMADVELLSTLERDVAVLRVANEVDDYPENADSRIELMVQLTEQLDEPALREMLLGVYALGAEPDVQRALRIASVVPGSRAPRAYRLRVLPALRRFPQALRRTARRVPLAKRTYRRLHRS